jgi:hypothetical protein
MNPTFVGACCAAPLTIHGFSRVRLDVAAAVGTLHGLDVEVVKREAFLIHNLGLANRWVGAEENPHQFQCHRPHDGDRGVHERRDGR